MHLLCLSWGRACLLSLALLLRSLLRLRSLLGLSRTRHLLRLFRKGPLVQLQERGQASETPHASQRFHSQLPNRQ